MKKNYFLALFILLSISSTLASANTQDIDSSVSVFQRRILKAQTDTERISLFLQLGQFYRDQAMSYQNDALNAYRQALKLSEQSKLIKRQNECMVELAVQYAVLKNFNTSRQLYNRVLKYYEDRKNSKESLKCYDDLQARFRYGKNLNTDMLYEALTILSKRRALAIMINDKLEAIRCIKDMGDVNLNLGRLSLAELQLLDALRQYKENHYQKLRDTYYLLGAVYHLMSNLNKELFYCTAMLKEATAARDTSEMIMGSYKLGRVYEDLGMYENSLAAYKQIKTLSSIESEKTAYWIDYRISLALVNLHRPTEALHFLKQKYTNFPPGNSNNYRIFYNAMANCYMALKKYQPAQYYLKKMISTGTFDYNLIGVKYEMALLGYKQLCEFYIQIGDYRKAKLYLDKAVGLPQFNVSAIMQSNIHYLQFKVDSSQGKLTAALRHFQRYKQLNDSIYNIRTSIEVAHIRNQNEISQKDKDILLLKKQSLIDQEKYRSRKITGNFLIGGVLLLLLLLTVLYSRYLLKRRNVIVLQENEKEISGKNKVLQKLLRENEWLLKEVHHRVKNNLHTIAGLLNSQTRYLKDEVALNAVLDSQHRVNAMSLIHQKLYKSTNVTSIYMPEYIEELVDYLTGSFKTRLKIHFIRDIAQIMLDIIYAVPVGLILNEVITNAVKHAFPFSDNDTISIKLAKSGDNKIILAITDNGRGIPADFDLKNNSTFGMVLIQGLVEDLNGTFLLENRNGTAITIAFSVE